MCAFSELVGRTVVEVLASPDNTLLCFRCKDGTSWLYEAEGECCNSVWFESLQGLADLVGREVLGVDEKEWEDVDLPPAYDGDESSMTTKFWTIRTAAGRCDIEVRNQCSYWLYSGDVVLDDEHSPETNAWSLARQESLKALKVDFSGIGGRS